MKSKFCINVKVRSIIYKKINNKTYPRSERDDGMRREGVILVFEDFRFV